MIHAGDSGNDLDALSYELRAIVVEGSRHRGLFD
jgi:hypothetical protein